MTAIYHTFRVSECEAQAGAVSSSILAEDNRQQPVAIRVSRPYGTADEFLERELETLTRTSVTLIGAQERPKGVILRFEVMLASGAQLLRGEGRVVGYKENAYSEQPGLVLRFTRLDTKSKALVDRAAAMREARARAALQAAMGEESLPPQSFAPSSIGPMSVATTPSSRAPIPASSDRVPGVGFETPRFERPTSSRPSVQPMSSRPQSSGNVPDPSSGSSFSFDENTFAAEGDGPITTANPRTASSKPSVPPVPPSSPTVADDRFAAHVKQPGSEPRLPRTAPGDLNREPLLNRLRERAKALSPDKLNALVRR